MAALRRVWTRFREFPVWAQIAIAVVAAAIIVAASSGGAEDEPEDTTAALTTTTTRPDRQRSTTTARSLSRCIDVPAQLVADISDGLKTQGPGSLRFARAVKSNDFSSVYFITADIQASGLNGTDDFATWSTNRLDGGLIFSVDGVAKEFSDWGDGGKTDAELSMDDDGAGESVSCAHSAAGA